MKKLIISGCSYTTLDYRSSAHPEMDFNFPKWPEILAKKLNMELVNLAFNGAGNRFILQTLLEGIERTPKEEIGMVVAAWSQANRDDWQEFYRTGHPIKFANENFIQGFEWLNNRIRRPGDIFSWVRESLLGFVTLQNVCKRYAIPLKQFQMIGLYEPWIKGLGRVEEDRLAGLPKYVYKGNTKADRQQIKLIIKEYEPLINNNSFVGYKTNNPNDLNDKLSHPMDWCLDDDIHKISKIDEHPNKQGHQKLSEVIYDRFFRLG